MLKLVIEHMMRRYYVSVDSTEIETGVIRVLNVSLPPEHVKDTTIASAAHVTMTQSRSLMVGSCARRNRLCVDLGSSLMLPVRSVCLVRLGHSCLILTIHTKSV